MASEAGLHRIRLLRSLSRQRTDAQLRPIRSRNSYQTQNPAVRNYCTPYLETLEANEADAAEATGETRFFARKQGVLCHFRLAARHLRFTTGDGDRPSGRRTQSLRKHERSAIMSAKWTIGLTVVLLAVAPAFAQNQQGRPQGQQNRPQGQQVRQTNRNQPAVVQEPAAAVPACPFGGPGPMGGQFGRGAGAGWGAAAGCPFAQAGLGGPQARQGQGAGLGAGVGGPGMGMGKGRGPQAGVGNCPFGQCPLQAGAAFQPGMGRGPGAGAAGGGGRGRGQGRGAGNGAGGGAGRGPAR